MNKLLTLASALTLSASLAYADTISLEPGWNLLGAGTEQIDINATFAGKDVSLVWGFRNIQKEWIATSPDGTLTSAIISGGHGNFESVPTHMGYWVKNNSTTSEQITLQYINDTNSVGFTQADVLDKTVYIVEPSTLNYFAVQYSDTYGDRIMSLPYGSTFSFDTNVSQNYEINENGHIEIIGHAITVEKLSREDDYVEVNTTVAEFGTTQYQRVYEDKVAAQAYLDSLTPTIFQSGETWKGLVYETIISAETGRVWLDRNLGASQACTAFDDTACYGDYYQWGREADGHEKSDSVTTSTLATSINNIGVSFIISSGTDNYDWVKDVDSNGSLRSVKWSSIDGTSVCPVGYRVPTIEELKAETIDYEETRNDEFNSFLKFPLVGERSYSSGLIYYQGMGGFIWSSSTSDFNSYGLGIQSNNVSMATVSRADARPVRCIQDAITENIVDNDLNDTAEDVDTTVNYPQVWAGTTSVSVPGAASSCSWDIVFTLNENNSASAAATLTGFTGEGSTECDSFSSNLGSVSDITDTSISFNIDSTSSDYIFGGNIFNLTINGDTATETMNFIIDGFNGTRTTTVTK